MVLLCGHGVESVKSESFFFFFNMGNSVRKIQCDMTGIKKS